MATTFKGWGGAWGDSWGAQVADPNALAGSAALHIAATGTLSNGGVPTHDMTGSASFAIVATGSLMQPDAPAPAIRAAVTGSGGPGTHINLSDYLRQFGRGLPVAPVSVQQILQTTRTRRARRQRREEEILLLCAPD